MLLHETKKKVDKCHTEFALLPYISIFIQLRIKDREDGKNSESLVRESKMAIDIGLTKEARHGVIEILNKILCDEILFR